MHALPPFSRRTFLRHLGKLTAAAGLGSFVHTGGTHFASRVAGGGVRAAHAASRPSLAQTTQIGPEPQQVPLAFKIGQMLLIGFEGTDVDDESALLRDVRESHVGGIVLFRYNVAQPAQLAALTIKLQQTAWQASGLPLLIATDQEGGQVSRLDERFGLHNDFSAQALGARNGLDLNSRYAVNFAGALRQYGINLNLAPVVDLNTNPENPAIGKLERSFAADPDLVTRHAAAFIQAHRERGIFCTLKHFPGHGSSARDSHEDFVDVTDTWRVQELKPYDTLVRAGQVDAVMTGHIFNARLDANHPATLSSTMIDGLLRTRLGYDGLILSDDLQMNAIGAHYSLEDAIRLAIQAGVDVLSFCMNFHVEEGTTARIVEIVRGLVESGVIPVERIDQSYQRIRRTKAQIARWWAA